jgi:hypothetical protein
MAVVHRRTFVSLMLVVGILLLAAAPAEAARPSASPLRPTVDMYRSIQLAQQYAVAYTGALAAVEPYVVALGNALVLLAPAGVLGGIDADTVRSIRAGLRVVNGKLADGTIKIPAAVLRSGLRVLDGWTGTYWNWWGQTSCISHSDLWNAQNGLFAGVVVAALEHAMWGLGIGFGVALWFFMWADHGNGACYNQPWAGPGWMSSQ